MGNATLRTFRSAGSVVGSMLKGATRTIAALLGRIASRLAIVAPLVLGAGCTSDSVDASVAVPTRSAPGARETPASPQGASDLTPRLLGNFKITFYYVIGEDEVKPAVAVKAAKKATVLAAALPAVPVANENSAPDEGAGAGPGEPVTTDDSIGELASIVVPELVALYDKSCTPIAKVSKEFAAQITMQGTGKLSDGRVLNVSGRCDCPRSPCFHPTSNRWGTGGTGRPLQPFRTVAADPRVVKLGSLLYIPALEGRMMPGRAPWGGFIHDGCVVADDTGGGIKGKQLDLFVGRRGYYRAMSKNGHGWARNVEIFDGAQMCERDGRKIARKAGAS